MDFTSQKPLKIIQVFYNTLNIKSWDNSGHYTGIIAASLYYDTNLQTMYLLQANHSNLPYILLLFDSPHCMFVDSFRCFDSLMYLYGSFVSFIDSFSARQALEDVAVPCGWLTSSW